ncbi:MAG: hypothetical protein JOZ08_19560 [Verrucomicrobia bacterium]|nr:hypothetical protein [Verrucomicrobiota bacterium]
MNDSSDSTELVEVQAGNAWKPAEYGPSCRDGMIGFATTESFSWWVTTALLLLCMRLGETIHTVPYGTGSFPGTSCLDFDELSRVTTIIRSCGTTEYARKPFQN